METVELKIKSFEKALATFVEISTESETTIIRDATLQRFEYTFDLAWKAIKSWLMHVHGISYHSPKSCLRQAFTIGLINERETEIFLEMVNERNLTTHVYMEEIADEVFQHIRKLYTHHLQQLADKLKKSIAEYRRKAVTWTNVN